MQETASLPAGWLMAIAALAILTLLFLIIRVRLNPILALILVSAATAIATGIPVEELVPTLIQGMGDTLGNVVLLIGLGAILGRMIEVSGGARVLADGLLRLFGERRAPLALSVACLLFGFPIFLDAAFVVMLPIIFSVARRMGGSVLLYALPATGAFLVMHALLPPHPGPVGATEIVGANMGFVVVLGLVVGLPAWYLGGYRLGLWLGRRHDVPVPAIFGGGTDAEEETAPPPRVSVLLFLLLLPLVLIFLDTGLATLAVTGHVDPDALWVRSAQAIGATPSALFISVLAALWLLGWRRRHGGDALNRIIDQALAPVCSIIILTGAGGMFGAVLSRSGIGEAMTGYLDTLGIPLLVAAFLVALVMRVAQGSATVAATTAAGFIAPAVAAADGNYSAFQLALIVVAMAAGSIMLSHVNDSGFWLVRGFLRLDTATMLKTWTVQSTAVGTLSFAGTCALYLVA